MLAVSCTPAQVRMLAARMPGAQLRLLAITAAYTGMVQDHWWPTVVPVLRLCSRFDELPA